MRTIFVCATLWLTVSSCQKAAGLIDVPGNDNLPGIDTSQNGGNPNFLTIKTGDTLSYEVITADTAGWFGIWNEPGGLMSNPLDSVTYGSPIYYKSGWRKSFVCPSEPFQAFISVASTLYNKDITVNLYKGDTLVQSVTNDAMTGVAKLMQNAETDTFVGTANAPVLTYEVLLSNRDTTQFESDSWSGQWNLANGIVSDLNNPLLSSFAIPSGWIYSFKPNQLPFTMYLAGSPYTLGGSTMTINFYVNNQLVKTTSSQQYIYDNRFVVQ